MVGSTLSEPIDLRVGSPQGSLLSPTIFIILLADIELWCPGAELCGYENYGAQELNYVVMRMIPHALSMTQTSTTCKTNVRKR